MKSATIVFILLVAMLLLAAAPLHAAALLEPEQVEQSSALEQDATDDAEAPNEEGEDNSGVVDLRATAARLRGRVELGWRVNEQAGEGVFVVERSTNGSSWRPVKTCSQRFDRNQADFGCTDTRLTSGTTYDYRVCITAKGTTCSSAFPSEPVTVKAP